MHIYLITAIKYFSPFSLYYSIWLQTTDKNCNGNIDTIFLPAPV